MSISWRPPDAAPAASSGHVFRKVLLSPWFPSTGNSGSDDPGCFQNAGPNAVVPVVGVAVRLVAGRECEAHSARRQPRQQVRLLRILSAAVDRAPLEFTQNH